MEIRGIFWFAIFGLVSSVLSSRTENIFNDKISEINESGNLANDRNDWRGKNAENSVNGEQTIPKREAGTSKRGIDANKTGCSRYCIQKRISALDTGIDSIKRVNIIWKIVNDSRVTFTGDSSWGMSGSQDKELRWEPSKITLENSASFNDDEVKCELYLQLGCEIYSKANISAHAILDEYLNRELKNLASMDHAEGYAETEFNVDESTEELRIFAVGKLSQAILEIPIAPRGNSTAARRPRPTLSLSRTSDAKGVRLDARNPPSGGWRLKLVGLENSNYSFSVVAASQKIIAKHLSTEMNLKTGISEPEESTEKIEREEVDVNPSKNLSMPQRLAYLRSNDEKKATRAIKFNDEQMILQPKLVREEHSADKPEVIESSTLKDFAGKVEISESNEMKSMPKFVRQVNLDAEIMEPEEKDKIIAGRSSDEAAGDETAKIVEDSELEELSRGVEDGQTILRKTVVDVHPNTELIAKPGSFHDVVFTVRNNQVLGIRHAFQGRSTHFQVIAVIPSVLWISPGQEVNVAVRIAVPNIQDTVPNTVTLYVGGSENFEVVEKSTYIYVQGSSVTTTDNDKPSIDYSFNDNCAGKLSRERCVKSRWSVEITAKDSDSGLKRVTSLPEGIEPRTQFIAGTKNSVNFYYISSCCYTTVQVTATDVQGNTYTRTIDVTEWDNLSQGEIAAIVVGALLILLLIILIILIVVYCIRKRKSHDLSYSQRYGSRTPASAERTNF